MSNLHIDDLLDLAYEISIENFGEETFTFGSLWSKTWKQAGNFKKELVEDWIGNFYTELLLDPRFVNAGNDKWRLKEYMSYLDYKKLDKLLIQDERLFDEDYDKTVKTDNKIIASDGEVVDELIIGEEEVVIEEKIELEDLIDSEI